MEIEVRALTSLKHEHIVEFFFVERIHNTVLLFLEYMQGVRKIEVNQNMLALILYIKVQIKSMGFGLKGVVYELKIMQKIVN